MACRRQSQDAPPNRRRPERASAVALNLQKQGPYRPLRRSQRLNRLRQPNEITPEEAEQPPATAGERRSLSPGLQYSTRCAVSPSEPAPSLIHVSHPRGQKRIREDYTLGSTKRRRASDTPPASEESLRYDGDIDPIDYWRRSGCFWPQGDWSKKSTDINPAMSHILARKKSTGSLRRKWSDSESIITPSDQKPREAKSAPYRDARYVALLTANGSFMKRDKLGIAEKSKVFVQRLLDQEQQVPQESLFRDDIFEATCDKLKDKNETRVIRDVSLLIVPSAEILTTYGANELACLIESVNEGWNNSIPLTPTRPQPDYAVGFCREAFTEEQLGKLQPFVGELIDQSFFMATYYLYFPFLTCEAKCGTGALDVADRQNAHSMTLAARAVVELFRLVGREKELDREILAFSVSHNHRSVRIYGHYPVIEATKTTFYRYSILDFGFTAREGKDKWTAYKFTKNIYYTWMPTHFKRLCSVIDTLPTDPDFRLSQQPELRLPDHTGLSQDLESHDLSGSNAASTLPAWDHDGRSQPQNSSGTPNTSFTSVSAQRGRKGQKGAAAKRGRKL
ncbi:MAG: hypothetical protein M1813_003766 [Trichoglossum hirsutum]|nr:MAG: hypothetical protein M1813_003766 [Trichoglossum hirsutum]